MKTKIMWVEYSSDTIQIHYLDIKSITIITSICFFHQMALPVNLNHSIVLVADHLQFEMTKSLTQFKVKSTSFSALDNGSRIQVSISRTCSCPAFTCTDPKSAKRQSTRAAFCAFRIWAHKSWA